MPVDSQAFIDQYKGRDVDGQYLFPSIAIHRRVQT